MYKKSIKIEYAQGIHTRPSQYLMRTAEESDYPVEISLDDKQYLNCKSIMTILGMCISKNNTLFIRSNDIITINKIISLIKNNFNIKE
jgi:phosphotransferase system HPr (HPr) family protein